MVRFFHGLEQKKSRDSVGVASMPSLFTRLFLGVICGRMKLISLRFVLTCQLAPKKRKL